MESREIMKPVENGHLTRTSVFWRNCRAIRLSIKQGMVKVNTWVFILRRHKWHIHAGSWSLVNSGGKAARCLIKGAHEY